VLVQWCDEIVCAKAHHLDTLRENFALNNKKTYILDIPDNYNYRDPKLVKLIKQRYDSLVGSQPKQRKR